MPILTTSHHMQGDKVTRGGDVGVITWPVNSHWADCRFQRPDGSQYVERAYLPECIKVNKVKAAA